MKAVHTLVILILFVISPVSAQQVVLTGATVYDGTGGPPVVAATVHIQDGRIVCVGTAAVCPVPDGVAGS